MRYFFLSIAALALLGLGFPARGDDWHYEKGKWYYYTGPNEPFEEGWLMYEGEWYYIGKNGEMKTGFVTDPLDGKKYYFGENGILMQNDFSADGKYYIGADGTELTLFDDYRKQLEKALNTALSKNAAKKTADGQEEGPAFTVMDLNKDGYRDILVGNRAFLPDHFLSIQLWDPEEKKFTEISGMQKDDQDVAFLCFDGGIPGSYWYIQTDGMNRYDYFKLAQGAYRYEHLYHFDTDVDEYGDILYYRNEEELDYQTWMDMLYGAKNEAGTLLSLQMTHLSKESIAEEKRALPSQEEMEMWGYEEQQL